MQNLTKKVMFGKAERYSFSKIDEIVELPDFLDIQRKAYREFLETGIQDVLDEFSPIVDYSGKAKLYLLKADLSAPSKYSIKESKRRGLSYTIPLKVQARFVIEETGEAIDQEVFLGDIPYMTDDGSFIVNGIERVVINQVIRSPSVYFAQDKNDTSTLTGKMIPTRGMWVEFELGANDVIRIVLDRKSKVTVGVFLKCFGFTTKEILKMYGDNPHLKNVLDKEPQATQEEAILELARKMRPGEIPSVESTRNYLNLFFFSDQYYNLGKVGRYKFNKKLSIANRVTGHISANNITFGDELIVKKNAVIDLESAQKIQNSGINEVWILFNGKKHLIRGNNRVQLSEIFPCDEKELGITELVYFPVLLQILNENKGKSKKIVEQKIKENAKSLIITTLTIDDILASISYFLDLMSGIGNLDNIDHLSNRRIATVGELLGNAFRSGVNKLATAVKETLQGKELTGIAPKEIVNPRFINKALRDFMATSQLSQLMEQINCLSGLGQKRKMSAVGPGGVKKERASAQVRDVHYTHYGRICAIETPEGQSIGLINSFTCFAKINDYGFLETPYRAIDKKTGVVQNDYKFYMSDLEDTAYIAQATEPLTADGKLANQRITCRHKSTIVDVPSYMVDYIDVSPRQFISAATSLIPFLNNDDSARALMGANMQRQAVPLLQPEAPLVGTGMEYKVAYDSGAVIKSRQNGTVIYVSADYITIKSSGVGGAEERYYLTKFEKTNADTCINQTPIVKKGEKVKVGDVLTAGYSTDNGELALGKNVLVGFLNWEGYNYEDAILISERIVKEDVFTSITLKVEEIMCRSTKLGDEEITRDIPNLGDEALKNLDENGIIRIGAEVRPGDILVGKVTPKGETELTPEKRLLRAIFGEKSHEVRDTSLRVQHGRGGVVVDVQVFSRKNKDELEPGVTMKVKVYVAQRRKLSVGDKMSGRHGNKGVVSLILPESDMPYLSNGQALDIVLNPLGVPSRLNIGQVLETHLGLVAKSLGWKIASPAFDGAESQQIQKLLIDNGFPADGKIQLYDGRTGLPFDNPATVGYKYMLKLEHMVDGKIHARSTGPYSLVTQQPLGGKAMFGGQKVGEMEFWALEAYGVSSLIQEFLTVKSDDVTGRTKTFEAIIKGQPIAAPGIPESFKVLIKELQSLALDIKILTEDEEEVSISQFGQDEYETPNLAQEVEQELKDIHLNFDEENAIVESILANEPTTPPSADEISNILGEIEVDETIEAKEEKDLVADDLFEDFDNFEG
ncbi:MAG: DNA-directed RNA polymerase subunit beta [Clostridia bacterium]|nr:DNA-directed RNA polymerase subunit beta [Clostridia bacterium]